MGSTTFKASFVGDFSGLDKATKGAADSVGNLGSKLGTVASVAGGFIVAQGLTKLGGFLVDAAKGAAEDEAATMRLEQALRNAGGAFDEHLGKVNERIAAGAKLAFSDDEVRDSFQSLLASTGDVDQALQRQSAAMDLARGAGIPLEAATRMLGKINEENVEVFKRMGITLGENATEADALAAVQAKFGGQSEQYAKSTAGQFEQLQIRMAEAKETIGAALIPVMVAVGDVLANHVMPELESFATLVGPLLTEAFAIVKAEVLPVLQDVGAAISEKVVPPLQQLAKWFSGNQEAMTAAAIGIGTVLVVAFGALAISAGAAAVSVIAATAPILSIVAVVAALGAGIYLLVQHWDQAVEKFPILGTIVDGVKEQFANFTAWISSDLLPAAEKIKELATVVGQFVIDWFVEHWPQIETIVKPIVAQVVLQIETIAKVVRDVIGLVVDLIQGDWSGAWEHAKQIMGTIVEFMQGTRDNFIGVLRGAVTLAGTVALEIADAIAKHIRDLGPRMLALGGDVVRGLWNGIIDLKGWIIDQVKSFAGDVIEGFKSGFGIFSPSKLMAAQVGIPIAQGVALGMMRGFNDYVYPTAAGLAANAAHIAGISVGGGHGPARSLEEQGDSWQAGADVAAGWSASDMASLKDSDLWAWANLQSRLTRSGGFLSPGDLVNQEAHAGLWADLRARMAANPAAFGAAGATRSPLPGGTSRDAGGITIIVQGSLISSKEELVRLVRDGLRRELGGFPA